MKKGASVFFCQNCGYESAKWAGQCPACRQWNTFAEEPFARRPKGHRPAEGAQGKQRMGR